MRAAIEKLKRKPESYRHKLALLTASGIMLVVVTLWATSNGFVGLPQRSSTVTQYDATRVYRGNSISIDDTPSPIENSKGALGAALSQFMEEWNSIKDSMANVFTPFISGIEVYQSK